MSAATGGSLSGFRHEALFYSGWQEFVAQTVPFIQAGLDAGDPVLVVEPIEKIHMLRVALGGSARAVHFANMAEVGSNPARIIPAWQDFIDRHGGAGRRPRGIGEPIWAGRPGPELVECQRHESLLNVAFAPGPPWWLLCPYDIGNLDPWVVDEARRCHPMVAEESSHHLSDVFRGLGASAAPFSDPLPEPGTGVTTLRFGIEELASVRSLVARAAGPSGLDLRRAEELVMAVHEVATNSIRHGGGHGSLKIWQDQSALVCEVRDKGGFDDPLVDRRRPPSDPRASRGLWLANQLCDLVQIRSFQDGTVVRLHMRRHAYVSLLPEIEQAPPHAG